MSRPDVAREDWLTAALRNAPRCETAEVDGAPIAYRCWGSAGRTPVVLVHGSSANSAWWEHVAPHLAHDRLVVAFDLSGHGDSGRRPAYDYDTWAREIHMIARTACGGQPPVVVAHSFGGVVALHADQLAPRSLASVVAVDAPLRRLADDVWIDKVARSSKPIRLYRTRSNAVAAFHAVPAQAIDERIRVAVAQRSITSVDGGWRWKFDRRVYDRPQFDLDALRPTDTPVTLIRAEFGSLSLDASRTVAGQLGPATEEITILGAHHHVMFDQPIALIATLQALLCDIDRARRSED